MKQRIQKIEIPHEGLENEQELHESLEPLRSIKAPPHLRLALLKRMRETHRLHTRRQSLWRRRVTVPLPLAVAIVLALIALALSHLPLFEQSHAENRPALAQQATVDPLTAAGVAASDKIHSPTDSE